MLGVWGARAVDARALRGLGAKAFRVCSAFRAVLSSGWAAGGRHAPSGRAYHLPKMLWRTGPHTHQKNDCQQAPICVCGGYGALGAPSRAGASVRCRLRGFIPLGATRLGPRVMAPALAKEGGARVVCSVPFGLARARRVICGKIYLKKKGGGVNEQVKENVQLPYSKCRFCPFVFTYTLLLNPPILHLQRVVS